MLSELFATPHLGRKILCLTTLSLAVIPLGCGPECEERTYYAEEYVLRVLESNQQCNYDSDCAVMNVMTSCSNLCPQAVSIEGQAQVQSAIDYADELWCADAGSQGCGFLNPQCPRVDLVYCDVSAGGVCTALYQ